MEKSLNAIIEKRIIPHVEYFFERISQEEDNIVVDGVKGFNGVDVFVPGKVVNACSYVLVRLDPSTEKYEKAVENLRKIVNFTSKYEMKTWGIYFYLMALNRLKNHGLLDKIVSPEVLEVLKSKLDWRKFIRADDLTLIDLPTNYYGCGLGVARYRELLGWENEGASKKLFDKLVEHIDAYSGSLSYSDETPGEGRFDRYSVLLPGEICARLVDTGMEVPQKFKDMLRKSCEIHLQLANEKGSGFPYGRTIGTYGDSSILEVLSIAAYLNVLSEEEKELAYAFCMRISQRFADFWLDKDMMSVNMWEKGRKADPYMGKNRILGENLSLCHQHIHTCEFWNAAGFKDKEPIADYEERLKKLPRFFHVIFATGEYDRGLAIVRDGSHVITLPIVNGGSSQYDKSPYFPIPDEIGMLENSPAEKHPNLIPKFYLKDGRTLMNLSWMKDIKFDEKGDTLTVTYRQDELCLTGKNAPQKDDTVKSNVTYTFSPGSITREDTYIPVKPVEVNKVYMEFGTFSENARVSGNKVCFDSGSIYEIQVEGLDLVSVDNVEGQDEYKTPHGMLKNRLVWEKQNLTLDRPYRIRLVIKYR